MNIKNRQSNAVPMRYERTDTNDRAWRPHKLMGAWLICHTARYVKPQCSLHDIG